MIVTAEGSQYLYGTKYNKKTDVHCFKFKYDILSYPRKSYGQIINNLIATQGRLTIKTNYDLKWKVREFIIDNFNKKYQIQEIQTLPQEVNPQVAALFKVNPDTDFVLSLIEVENMEELQ